MNLPEGSLAATGCQWPARIVRRVNHPCAGVDRCLTLNYRDEKAIMRAIRECFRLIMTMQIEIAALGANGNTPRRRKKTTIRTNPSIANFSAKPFPLRPRDGIGRGNFYST